MCGKCGNCSKSCRLLTMLSMTAGFFLVEIIVGYITNSIALVADSFHMLSDVLALIVGFAAVRISKWPSKNNTFGWVRVEILGALVNAVFLVALCFSISMDALKRIVQVEEVEQPVLLLAVGGAGLAVNLIGLCLFGGHHGHSHGGGGGHGHSHGGGGHGHSHGGGGHAHEGHGHSHLEDGEDEILANGGASDLENSARKKKTTEVDALVSKPYSVVTADSEVYVSPSTNIKIEVKKQKPAASSADQMNMRGVFLHVLGDALGSVVVIVSALVIMFGEGDWKYYVDPVMSLMMVCLILCTTYPLLRDSASILLQTVPKSINVESIISELENMNGIHGVHECHIWQLAGSRIVASAHIRCQGIDEYMNLATKIKALFHNAGIHSTTIQPEFVNYEDQDLHTCAITCRNGNDIDCGPSTCCGDRATWLSARIPSTTLDLEDLNLNNSAISTRSQAPLHVDYNISPAGDEVVLEMTSPISPVVVASESQRCVKSETSLPNKPNNTEHPDK